MDSHNNVQTSEMGESLKFFGGLCPSSAANMFTSGETGLLIERLGKGSDGGLWSLESLECYEPNSDEKRNCRHVVQMMRLILDEVKIDVYVCILVWKWEIVSELCYYSELGVVK